MKQLKNIPAKELVQALTKIGYSITRQKGSHIRMSAFFSGATHHITIPNHDPIKIGTLSAIIKDIAENRNMSKEEITNTLFG